MRFLSSFTPQPRIDLLLESFTPQPRIFGLLLAPPTFKSIKTLGDRAFQMDAPTLWNKLLSTLKAGNELKAILKTLRFKETNDL